MQNEANQKIETPKTDSENLVAIAASLQSINGKLTFFVVITILAIIINLLF